MTTPSEIEAKFWKSLKSDMTAMLGLSGDSAHAQPMTAQLDEDLPGRVWFFTSSETDLLREMGERSDAFLHFASKDHELFAAIEGELVLDNDQDVIDRLWNPFVAAWFEGGKQDPKLRLLRFDPEDGRVWLNEHSLFAGVKMLLGHDPKQDYKDNVADVRLG